jgi:hypothetical protein
MNVKKCIFRSAPIFALALLTGCSSSQPDIEDLSGDSSSSISKLGSGTLKKINSLVINEHMAVFEIGKLDVNINLPKGVDIKTGKIYLDNFYIGNLTENRKVFTLKRGLHSLKIEFPECETYKSVFMLLGNPNEQVLNVFIEKEKIAGK